MAASFRAGGYRSTSNYFARAKEQHLQCIGEPVSPRTSCAIKQAIRAADRGSLSSQLKESFELELFASSANQTGETHYDTTAEYIRSTEFAVNFTILGSWWMTREIELAAAKIVDVEQTSQTTVRWKLPASKNDTAGKGVWRSHGCCCPADKQGAGNPSFCGNKICPFHVMIRHIKLSGPSTESTPLFPNLLGQHLSKHESISLIHRAVAWVMGFDDSEQVTHIGGHALRVAGAQALARAGTDTTLIQLVGRWGSAAILRYIQSAPLERSHLIASDLAKNCVSANIKVVKEVPRLEPIPQSCTTAPTAATPTFVTPRHELVRNIKTNLLHRARGQLIGPSNSWRVLCGWDFINSKFGFENLGRVAAEGPKCPRCFKSKETDGGIVPANTSQADEPTSESSSSSESSDTEEEGPKPKKQRNTKTG